MYFSTGVVQKQHATNYTDVKNVKSQHNFKGKLEKVPRRRGIFVMLANVVSIQSGALKDELATSSRDTYRASQFITMMCTY